MNLRRLLLLTTVAAITIVIGSVTFAERTGKTGSRASVTVAAAHIPAPEEVLGFRPGDDRKLASWARVVEYFQRLAAASDRVKFEEIGKSTMGAPFVYATISAPENLAQLDEYKNLQRQLADPRTLGSPTHLMSADRKAASLIQRGKTVIAITC